MRNEYADSFLKPYLTGNFVLDLNPVTKILVPVFIAVFAVAFGDLPFVLPAIAAYFLIAAAAGKLKPFFSLYIKIILAFGLIMFILRALFMPPDGTEVLLSFWIIELTVFKIYDSLVFTLGVMAVCGCIILMGTIIPAKDIMYTLETTFHVSHSVSFVLLNAIQSIVNLGAKSTTIMESQSARGIETEGNLMTRFKAFLPVLAPVVLGALADTEEKAIAMDARAFSAKGRNTSIFFLRKTPIWEKLLVIGLLAVLIISIVWRFFL